MQEAQSKISLSSSPVAAAQRILDVAAVSALPEQTTGSTAEFACVPGSNQLILSCSHFFGPYFFRRFYGVPLQWPTAQRRLACAY